MQETAYPRCFNSLDAPRDRFAVDSPLEEAGFEPSVPPPKRRPWGGGPRPTTVVAGDDLCLMTHPAYRSGISFRQQPRDPFVRAVPKVRIRFPPAWSPVRT